MLGKRNSSNVLMEPLDGHESGSNKCKQFLREVFLLDLSLM